MIYSEDDPEFYLNYLWVRFTVTTVKVDTTKTLTRPLSLSIFDKQAFMETHRKNTTKGVEIYGQWCNNLGTKITPDYTRATKELMCKTYSFAFASKISIKVK